MNCPKCNREIPDDANLCCYCGRVIVKRAPAKVHQRPNGSGYACKRGKTWTAYYCDGWSVDERGVPRRHLRTKGGFRTKADALNHVAVLKAGTHPTEAPPLAHYWNLYATGELKRLSESKQVAYAIAWAKLESIEYRPIDTLTVHDLRQIAADKASSHYTARDIKVVLGHLYDLAGADGWVQRDLPDYIILPTLEEKERRPFSDVEQAALWKLYDGGDHRAALPLLMIYTGMMPGELLDLRKSMVDVDAQQIRGAGKKTKVRRESPIYLPDTIMPIIIDALAGVAGDDDRVWPMTKHQFYDAYYAVLEAAGCRHLEPYCCRHTTATALAVGEGIAPQTVRKIMRWSTTKMLDRYAHPDDSDAQAALKLLKR